jgi:chaperonin cofactor prefoldin
MRGRIEPRLDRLADELRTVEGVVRAVLEQALDAGHPLDRIERRLERIEARLERLESQEDKAQAQLADLDRRLAALEAGASLRPAVTPGQAPGEKGLVTGDGKSR